MSNFDCPHCGGKIHVMGATHSMPNQPVLEKADPQHAYMPFPETPTHKSYNAFWVPKAATAKANAKSTPKAKAKSNKRRTQRMTKSA